MKYLTNLDLNKNELQNVRIQNLATAPENPVEGQIYYNTADKVLYQWNGTAWATVGGDIPIASESVLGGVKVGRGLSAEANGTLSTDLQKIKVNGVEQTITNKEVDLAVLELSGGTMSGDIAMGGNTISGLAEPGNASDAATKYYVDKVAVGALKLKGSVAFADLPALGASELGNMYNITDEFTATADFVDEEVGKTYSAGTNVAIINVGTDASPVYKFDALTSTVDLSAYPTKTEVNGIFSISRGFIETDGTSATLTYTGILLDAYATIDGEKVIVDMLINQKVPINLTSSVTFSCATAPSSDILCTIVYTRTLS